jgi:hypothetical protein
VLFFTFWGISAAIGAGIGAEAGTGAVTGTITRKCQVTLCA